MSAADPAACLRCGTAPDGGKLDAAGWCAACREQTVRRATVPAYAAAAAVVLAYLAGVGWAGGFSSGFVVFWLALGGLLGFLAFKVARRVAFEVIRARSTRTAA